MSQIVAKIDAFFSRVDERLKTLNPDERREFLAGRIKFFEAEFLAFQRAVDSDAELPERFAGATAQDYTITIGRLISLRDAQMEAA